MYASGFRYHAPETLKDAAEILKTHGEQAKILAGGMSLVPLMKLRLAPIEHVIDIRRIREMRAIGYSGRLLTLGAGATHHAIEVSDEVIKHAPLMAETASWIGDPQVRNRGTIGGSLSHADPSGDWGACLIALRGTVVATDGTKERRIDSDQLFTDMFETSLKPGEILKSVEIKDRSSGKNGFAYMKMERKAGDFATVGVAVQLKLDSAGRIEEAGIGLAALGATSIRASGAEKFLKGKEPTEETIVRAAELAAEDADPSDDPLRGSSEFKKYMCGVYTRRGIKMAVERAGGVN